MWLSYKNVEKLVTYCLKLKIYYELVRKTKVLLRITEDA